MKNKILLIMLIIAGAIAGSIAAKGAKLACIFKGNRH